MSEGPKSKDFVVIVIRFYGLVLREAFRHSLDIAQGIIFVALAIAGFLTWRSPALKQTIEALDLGGWQIAVAVFCSIMCVRLILAPFWLWRDQHSERLRIKEELAEFQTEKSEIALSLDETDYQIPCFYFDGKPAEIAFFIHVANVNGHHLENCQIQLRYESNFAPKLAEYNYFTVSEPFSMRPDEITTAHILYADRDPINDPRKHLCVPALTKMNNKWERALGTPILVPGEVYNITVEALSASTRKSSLRIIASENDGHWVLRNASVR